MKLRESLRPLYIFTKFCGQCPYKYDNDKNIYTIDLLAICYTVGIILGVSTFLQVYGEIFRDVSAPFEYERFFGYFDLIYMNMIIICMCLKAKKITKVMSKMETFDKNLEKLIGPFESKSASTLTIIAVVLFFSNLVLYFLSRALVYSDGDFVHPSMMCWKEICTHSFKIQFCIIMNVPLSRLKLLCRYFHNLDIKEKKHLTDETLLQDVVEDVHSIHNELCSTCLDINNIYGIQTLIFFVKTVVAQVTAMYVVFRMKDELNLAAALKILSLCHWTMWRMFCLTMIAYLYHAILKQVSDMRRTIHKFLRKAKGQPLKATLRLFSLHEINRNLQFTVCGLFPIDLTMIQMAIATTATYVLILIQLRV